MTVKEYFANIKLLAYKLSCDGDNITKKNLLMRILIGLGHAYLDLTLIITSNRMCYNDTYALLLIYKARLEQTQGSKTFFNVNYSIMSANHSFMRGKFRK